MTGLRDRLIGAWRLVSFAGTSASGETIHPMGAGVRGHILYTADGHVAVNLMQADRERRGHGTRIGMLQDADAAPLARGYMAYSGAFEVDDSRSIVRHHFELCLDPDMIGTLQERRVTFIGDDLELSVPEARIDQLQQSVRLLWRRP